MLNTMPQKGKEEVSFICLTSKCDAINCPHHKRNNKQKPKDLYDITGTVDCKLYRWKDTKLCDLHPVSHRIRNL